MLSLGRLLVDIYMVNLCIFMESDQINFDFKFLKIKAWPPVIHCNLIIKLVLITTTVPYNLLSPSKRKVFFIKTNFLSPPKVK